MKPSIAFSCVVDKDSKFLVQAARLLLSLRWLGGSLRDADFYLSSTGELDNEASSFFNRHNAIVRRCDPFLLSQPHITSNKLRGLEFNELHNYEIVVLIDCDTLIVNDPSEFCRIRGVGLKVADLPTVDNETLKSVFKLFGLPIPNTKFEYDLVDDHNFGYFNSGVVILAQKWLEKFHQTWSQRCHQLLKNEIPINVKKHYLEQSALAICVAELNLPLTILPTSMNLPVHLSRQSYPNSFQTVDPVIIHYHGLSSKEGYIRKLPLAMAQLRVNVFNSRLRAAIQSRKIALGQNSEPRGKSDSFKKDKKVIVGSGWWCGDKPHDWALGSDVTRTTMFFPIWYRQIMKYINPERIVITDSASLFKPDWERFHNIHWIELDRNYGGPNDVRVGKVVTKLSGFTRSVINGAMYAYCCDADYYVYVEQDCVIRGHDFLARCMGNSDAEIFLGQRAEGGKGICGGPLAPFLQQSLIIVRKSGLERFISRTLEAPETDGELSPEIKMERDLKPFDLIKIPFGRTRPVDFALPNYYVQHLEDDEIEKFFEVEGIHNGQLKFGEKYIFSL